MVRKTKEEVSNVSDAVLKLVNRVKGIVQELQDGGIEYLKYVDILKLDKAFDIVVEEENLKYQQYKIEQGEDKGTVTRCYWKDLVRADHPDVHVEENDNDWRKKELP